MSEVAAPEVLLCDTSYVSHFERSLRNPARYQHWPSETLDRIAAAFVALNPIALAEIRAGYRTRNWGAARTAHMENQLRSYVLIPLSEATLDAYADLHHHCHTTGRGMLRDNDLWIAATAIERDLVLVTCDRAQSQLAGLRDPIYLPPP
jgi:predicted nucleic acid-binding protein